MNFFVMSYTGDGRAILENFPRGAKVSKREEGTVIIDPDKNVWYFQPAESKDREQYELGKAARVPEGDALWGPAFVGDHDNPLHTAAANSFWREYASRQLTR